MADPALGDERPLTRDAFLGGRLWLMQPAKGHRAGTDAVLLAGAVPRDFSGLAYDAGAGVGAAGLGLAILCPASRVGLIENEPLSAGLAVENIAANGLSGRASLSACDLLSGRDRRAAELDGKAELVVTNPPFYPRGTIRASPDARRQAAHVAGEGGAEAWILACLALLRPHGFLIIIHMTEALPSLLKAFDRRAGAVTVLPIHPQSGAPAKRILVRAIKGSRAPLSIVPGLVLHEAGGFSPEAERLHRGDASLDW